MCGLTVQLVGRRFDIQLSHASGLYTRSHLIKRPCASVLCGWNGSERVSATEREMGPGAMSDEHYDSISISANEKAIANAAVPSFYSKRTPDAHEAPSGNTAHQGTPSE